MKQVVILFLSVLLSCNTVNHKNKLQKQIIQENRQLFEIIDEYTSQVHCPYCRGSYPSNHVFFHLYKKDTLMTIFCNLYVIEHDVWWHEKLRKDKWWLNFLKSKTHSKYYSYVPDGIYWLPKKKPVVFFNTKLYKPVFKKHLTKAIPDTLNGPLCFAGFHGFKKWYYLYKNGKFIKIELKKDSVWKDKPYYIVK